jgi:hypothetical protein
LIIVNAIFGVKPKKTLIAKYNLTKEFGLLIDSVFSGNVFDFRRAIVENQAFYIQKELYLLIQLKIKNILYRNLIKKVQVIENQNLDGIYLSFVDTLFATVARVIMIRVYL